MTDTPMHHEATVISFGRSLRYVAGYALLIAVMLLSPLFVFIPAALFYAAVRHGRSVAWAALISGVALAGVVVVGGSNAPQTTLAEAHTSLAYLVGLTLSIALPAMIALPLIERAESFGRILLTGVVFGAFGLAATEVSIRLVAGFSPYADQLAAYHATAGEWVVRYQQAGLPSDAVAFLRRWMDIALYCFPASLLMEVALVFALSIVLFGRVRAWRDVVERRPASDLSPYLFRNLALPDWLLFGFILGGLSPLASGLAQRIGANLLAVVTFLYLLQGLAIFRAFVVATGAGFAGVTFAYVVLGLLTLTGIAPLLLSIAGLFDTFFDFRKFTRKDHSDESHLD